MDKMFKLGAVCPLKGCEVGCLQCVQCGYYVRDGTGTFIWCDRPREIAEKCTKVAPKGRKITKKDVMEAIKKNPERVAPEEYVNKFTLK